MCAASSDHHLGCTETLCDCYVLFDVIQFFFAFKQLIVVLLSVYVYTVYNKLKKGRNDIL